MWQVKRHGGRFSDEWRIVLETDDENQARNKYDELYMSIRQGAIELVDPSGERKAYHWAPRTRLRSNW